MLKHGDIVLVVLQPTFSYVYDDVNSTSTEIEYCNLPPHVQSEVIQFFQSEEFIKNTAEGYALHNITAMGCFITYPGYDTHIINVSFDVLDNKLLV